jgi:hypothetical protein
MLLFAFLKSKLECASVARNSLMVIESNKSAAPSHNGSFINMMIYYEREREQSGTSEIEGLIRLA